MQIPIRSAEGCSDGVRVAQVTTAGDAIQFRPRARLLRTIGADLISSDHVALVELVKNAFDADASTVVVRFADDEDDARLEVIDDGSGMSAKTARGTWAEIATPHRLKETVTPGGRRVLGAKGVGRFAAAKLGTALELVSREEDATREVVLTVDWSLFADDDAYLDEIPITLRSRKPDVFGDAGYAAEVWTAHGMDPAEHGTLLRLTELTSQWTEEEVRDLRLHLSRMVAPAAVRGEPFQVILDLPERLSEHGGTVGPPEELTNSPYELEIDVLSDGQYTGHVRVPGKRKEAVHGRLGPPKVAIVDGALPCGPFRLQVQVWDRDRESMEAQSGKLTRSAFSKLLDAASGVSVYRDGFRVLPYGEPKDDWLRLDARRVNSPTLRLSNNQIIGQVHITADDNPGLRDQTNREGLIAGPELDSLVSAIRELLSVVEERRYRQRRDPVKRARRTMWGDIHLSDVAAAVRERHPQDTKLIALVERREQAMQRNVERVQDVLARYTRLATIGRLVDEIVHDGVTAVGHIRAEVERFVKDSRKASLDCEEKLARAIATADQVERQRDVLSILFRRIAPFGGRRRGRPRTIELGETIENIVELIHSRAEKAGVRIDIVGPEIEVTLDPVEVQEVVYNLLDNAIYWLGGVPEGQREIQVETARLADDAVTVTVSDTGPGVPDEIRDDIFEPYFSRRDEGSGLGLSIAGAIVADYYDGGLELMDTERGASFRATFRRRT
jgi:signal transduction histidine kinase